MTKKSFRLHFENSELNLDSINEIMEELSSIFETVGAHVTNNYEESKMTVISIGSMKLHWILDKYFELYHRPPQIFIEQFKIEQYK